MYQNNRRDNGYNDGSSRESRGYDGDDEENRKRRGYQ